jgi:hypothetical protein
MGQRSAIEWTDSTWNPVTGCTKVSAGCDHCYAHALAHKRLRDVYLRQLPVLRSVDCLECSYFDRDVRSLVREPANEVKLVAFHLGSETFLPDLQRFFGAKRLSPEIVHMDERDLPKSLRGKSTPFLVLADSSGTVRWEGFDIAKAWEELRRSESP